MVKKIIIPKTWIQTRSKKHKVYLQIKSEYVKQLEDVAKQAETIFIPLKPRTKTNKCLINLHLFFNGAQVTNKVIFKQETDKKIYFNFTLYKEKGKNPKEIEFEGDGRTFKVPYNNDAKVITINNQKNVGGSYIKITNDNLKILNLKAVSEIISLNKIKSNSLKTINCFTKKVKIHLRRFGASKLQNIRLNNCEELIITVNNALENKMRSNSIITTTNIINVKDMGTWGGANDKLLINLCPTLLITIKGSDSLVEKMEARELFNFGELKEKHFSLLNILQTAQEKILK